MALCSLFLFSLVVQSIWALPTPTIAGQTATGLNEDTGKDLDITEINKDLDLFEGDIVLHLESQRNAIVGEEYRWDIPVPYELDESLDINAKGVILKALEQIRLKTCVDFTPHNAEPNYISVVDDEGCYSYVGNLGWGNQSLSIGSGCDHIAIVEHEFLHALGFWHEQSRYDRDDHVTIAWDNIEQGKEHNFMKFSSDQSSTLGTPYDYTSVMHYGNNYFSNGNGSTITTKLPEFQNVIGQRQEMSSNDVLKLNKLYNCRSSVTFLEACSFENETECDMSICSSGRARWQRVSRAQGGPLSDHTSALGLEDTDAALETNETLFNNDTDTALETNETLFNNGGGFFMHLSTVSGKEGDRAKMEFRKMAPRRDFQCLQFFYYHSGSDSDRLNIWIREYDGEDGAPRLMGQITGPPADYWQLHHVPLNATQTFRVEFEVRKGAGSSDGGFSLDDVNLSETECAHHVWHVRDFGQTINASDPGTVLKSPRFYTSEGYGYQVLVQLYTDHFGVFFRLVSGDHDDQLQWPCLWRQMTCQLLDQDPNIQQRMSKQISITTDPTRTTVANEETHFFWANPRTVGRLVEDSDGESYYAGPRLGFRYFLSYDALQARDFVKAGDGFFLLNFEDISSIGLTGSVLPKPHLRSTMGMFPHGEQEDTGPCSNQPMSSRPMLPLATITMVVIPMLAHWF